MFGITARAAESELGRMIVTAGLSTTNASTQTWAYVFWQASDQSLLEDQQFAVFRKDGPASSANAFAPAGVIKMQLEAGSIKLLLERAANLGDDRMQLEDAINEMFGGADLDPSLPLEEKIIAIMLGSVVDRADYDKLMFLARRHPALAMSMGTAASLVIPATTSSTFEVRAWVGGAAGEVVGRVTIDPSSPVLLPAPDALTEVPDTSPMGHLNVRLRWREPAALQRLSLLQFGYQVYRVNYSTAQTFGWTNGTPNRTAFLNVVAQFTNEAKRVNRLPVMATDVTASNTFFFADDNNRFDPGGDALADGSRYFYFVAAADLLGRPGLISTGLLVKICDRTPPLLPRELSVDVIRDYNNATSSATNHLRVSWRQDPAGDTAANLKYYVFRWASISQMQASAVGSLAGAIAGPIAHVTGEVFNSYTDTNSPAVMTTAFYTVQSAEITACGTNLSGNSGPLPAFIPDLSGPDILMTNITPVIRVCRPQVQALQPFLLGQTPVAGYTGVVSCTRPPADEDIDWVEFAWANGSKLESDYPTASLIGRYYFMSGQLKISIPTAPITNVNVTFFCRIGTKGGEISPVAVSQIEGLGRLVEAPFQAAVLCQELPIDQTNRVHRPRSGDEETPGPVVKPEVDFGPIPTNALGHQFLLHQQIDGGPLTLIGQFLAQSNLLNAVVTITNDMAGTLGCSEICLFSEQVDQNGFSHGQQLEGCYYSTLVMPPMPELLPIEPAGTETNPSMTLQWYCPPPGVERFEIHVGLEDESVPVSLAVGLTTNLAPVPNPVPVEDKIINYGEYQTGRVGQNFGTPDIPDFTQAIPIQLGKTYYVRVAALDACGNRTLSDVFTFSWYPVPTGPDVPWPSRPLPPVIGNFHPGIDAQFLKKTDFDSVSAVLQQDIPGVRVGVITQDIRSAGSCHQIPSTNNPVTYLFDSTTSGSELLPFMLYRYQVTNANFSRVSGDVVQVSPLIEEIGYEFFPVIGGIQTCDPFFKFLLPVNRVGNEQNWVYDIYVIDTQPVIAGADYVYLIVQFDETREPVRIIPVDALTIPVP